MDNFGNCHYDEVEKLKILIEKTKKISELIPPDYLRCIQRGKINESDRKKMIQKIMNLSDIQNLSKKSIQLSILLSDLFLSTKAFPNPDYLDLLVYTSTNLSSKFEVSKAIPLSSFELVSSLKVPSKVIQTAELFILNTLNWDINVPTPYEISSLILEAFPLDSNMEYLYQKIEDSITFCLEDYNLSQCDSFILAICSIVSSLWRFGMIQKSEKLVKSLSSYFVFQEEELKELSKLILDKFNIN